MHTVPSKIISPRHRHPQMHHKCTTNQHKLAQTTTNYNKPPQIHHKLPAINYPKSQSTHTKQTRIHKCNYCGCCYLICGSGILVLPGSPGAELWTHQKHKEISTGHSGALLSQITQNSNAQIYQKPWMPKTQIQNPQFNVSAPRIKDSLFSDFAGLRVLGTPGFKFFMGLKSFYGLRVLGFQGLPF